MSELRDFARRLIELEGGAVDDSAAGLAALVPPHLSEAWHVPEELVLDETEQEGVERLAYGTELLERMIETAVGSIPVVCAELEVRPPRLSQVQAAAASFQLRNGVVVVGQGRLGPQTRVGIDVLATLHGDEKRELLTSATVSLVSGAEVEGFESPSIALSQRRDACLPELPRATLSAALAAVTRRCEQQAQGFRAAMTRRYERDHQRIEGYFADLVAELVKRANKGRLDPAVVADKQRALEADRAAKLEALAARFVLRIEVMPIALRIVGAEGAFVSLTLRRRKASRALELEYDAATRRLVPPACESCGQPAPRPAACDDAVHLLCERCAPRADGRIACPACKPMRSAADADLLQRTGASGM